MALVALATHLGLSEKRRDAVLAASPVELLIKRFRYLQALLGIVRDAVRRGKVGFHRGVAARLIGQRFQLKVFPVSAAQLLREFGCSRVRARERDSSLHPPQEDLPNTWRSHHDTRRRSRAPLRIRRKELELYITHVWKVHERTDRYKGTTRAYST